MNTKIIAVAVLGIIILGLGGLLFYNQTNKPTQTIQEESKIEEPKKDAKSLLDLLSLGTNQACNFSYQDDKSKTEGVAYFTKDKLRVDLELTDDKEKATSMSLIRNSETNYIWGTSLEQGVKLIIPDEEFSTAGEISKYINAERKTDYECKSWTVDNTKFNPPSNIKFLDLSGFQATTTKSSSESSTQCEACSSLMGEAKTACLQGFNCPQ